MIKDQERLQDILQGIGDGLAIIDLDFRTVWQNRISLEIFGDTLGKICYQAYKNRNDICPDCPTLRALETGQAARSIQHSFDREGRKRWVELSTTPLLGDDGKVIGVIEVTHDITNRRAMQTKILRRNRELSALNAIAETASQSLDLPEILDHVVAQVKEIMGLDGVVIRLLKEPTGDLQIKASKGLSRDYLVCRFSIPIGESFIGQIATNGSPGVGALADLPEPARSHCEREGIVTFIAAPVKAKHKVVGSIFCFNRSPRDFSGDDLSLLQAMGNQLGLAVENARLYEQIDQDLQLKVLELGKALEEMRRAQAHAETVTRVSADGIMVVNADEVITGFNPALERLTGYSALEMIGQRCKAKFRLKDEEGSRTCDALCPFSNPAQPDQISHVEARLFTKSGREVWVEISRGLLRSDDGQIAGVVHTFRDLTERKETERLKDEFLTIASHELRTPITSLKGSAQLMLRRFRLAGQKGNLGDQPCTMDHSRDVKQLEVLDAQADRLSQLVGELLDISRLQAGALDLHLEETDIIHLAREIIEQLQTTTSHHHLRLRAPSEALRARVDGGRIEQVLTNLIDNAIKYSPNGGDIEIIVMNDGDRAVVSVKDSGIGIPPQETGKLFDRFYRGKGELLRKRPGLGLGLYLSQEIVKRHQGTIWAKNNQNGGSTFSFSLPLR